MHDAHIIRKLLLAIYVSLGVGKHDPGLHRAASVRPVPDSGVPQPVRVHGADDHVPEPRSTGGEEVRGDAQLGPEQDQSQVRQ